MNYVYLKDVQNLIKDGKNHKLSNGDNNPNYKFMGKQEIDNYINDMLISYKAEVEDIYLYLIDFANYYIKKSYSQMVIDTVKRFLEIIPKDLIDKIKFIAQFS